jgi:hypothetical protein
VVVFGVERGVRQYTIPEDQQRRHQQNRGELRGVVGRTLGDDGPGDEVRVRVEGGGQLGPGTRGVLALRTGNEVAGGVAAIQAGGINSRGRLFGDQFGLDCGRDGAFEEVEEGPPFKSRASA